jgi:serine/threonine-protein kinase RsbW
MINDNCNLHEFRISIKNELGLIYPVQASAKAYAEILGFKNKECYHIELLLEEILSNTIKYDFMPGQQEDINICFEKTTLGMALSIHSKSIPLDIEKIESFASADRENILKQNASGLGTLIINKLADNLTYTNKGRDGQFIYFEKNLPQEAIVDSNIFDQSNSELKVKSEFDFYMRRLKPEEALFISQLAYYAYHVSYIYDKIYYPESVRKLNEQGEMLSVVAVNKENEDIIGHVAAIKDELSGMTELAVAFVNPQYRGGGCLQKGSEFLIDLLKKENNEGVIVHAVTTHPYSQKAAYKLELRETALFISRLTPLLMNEIKDEDQARESLLHMYLPLKLQEIKTIYAPKHHSEMILRIYENIGQAVNIISEYPKHDTENELAEIEVSADSYGCSHIYLKHYGKNTKTIISKTLKSICVSRIESIYLYLPLECTETISYCAEFESLQFFFGGIIQKKDNMDFLMIQYLNNQVYQYNNVIVFSDFAKELLTYIQKHDPNQNI